MTNSRLFCLLALQDQPLRPNVYCSEAHKEERIILTSEGDEIS